MSLNALVYRSRRTLELDVEALRAVRDDRTGEFYFPTPEHDGKFSRDVFIACEFWIGNVTGLAALREEVGAIAPKEESILLEKVFYSGSHTGDVIELTLLPALELEIRDILERHGSASSKYLLSVLHGILGLIESAQREMNPIVFV